MNPEGLRNLAKPLRASQANDSEDRPHDLEGEELDRRTLGKLRITRASHVKPDAQGYWWASMEPS